MPSTYTTNGGIELPANGEQSGTWGETVNDNMAIIDRLTNGVGAVSLSGTTHTLTTADGTLSDGQYNVLVLGGSPSGTNTITISPNDGEHVYVVKNASGQTATFTQGSGANVSVLNNTTKIIYADGAGAGAAVVDITGALDLGSLIIAGTAVTATAAELNLLDGSIAGTVVNSKAVIYGAAGQVEATTVEFDNLSGTGAVSVTNILDEDNMASDSATALATQQSIKAYVDAQVDTVDTLAEILAIGNTTGATDIAVDSAQKVQFRDAAIYINSSVDGQLDIVADTEIQIAATTVDLNGNLDVSGDIDVDGSVSITDAVNAKLSLSGPISSIDMYDTSSVNSNTRFESHSNGLFIKSLNDDGTATQYIIELNCSNGNIIFFDDTSTEGVHWNAATKRLGIGTVSADTALDVTGTITADGLIVDGDTVTANAQNAVTVEFNNATGIISADRTGGNYAGLSLRTTAGSTPLERLAVAYNGDISFYEATGTTPKMVWKAADERLGIGTSSPSQGIHLKAASGNSYIKAERTTANQGEVGFNTDNWYMYQKTNDTSLHFYNTADRMTIDSSGSVGIGTSLPSTELHVVASSGYAELRLQGASGSSGTLEFYDSTTKRGDIFVDTSSNIIFRNITETMRIDSSGNVGIGRTPDTVYSGSLQLAFGNGSQLATSTAGNPSLTITDNSYFNASGNHVYKTTNPSTRLEQYNGTLTFGNAASGTAGDTISYAERMRIDSSGGLITTPAAGGHAVFNEGGVDADFRVESATDVNALFVQGSNGFVGLETGAPGYQLDLRRNDTGTVPSLGIRQIGTGDASMVYRTTTSPYGFIQGVDGSDADSFKIAFGTDDVGTNTALKISNVGEVTMPLQPAFYATPSSAQTNLPATDSATTVAMGTEIFDVGGNFASSTFTAPVTGKYQLNLSLYLSDVDTAAGYILIGIITTLRNYINIVAPKYASDPTYLTQNISTLADMDEGDTAYVFYQQSGGASQTDIQDDARASFFQGYLVA
jgi:cytoskeletal protein CcmA (bactofilin family)